MNRDKSIAVANGIERKDWPLAGVDERSETSCCAMRGAVGVGKERLGGFLDRRAEATLSW